MIKELSLVIRTVYSFFVALALTGMTGMSLSVVTIITIISLVFVQSFFLQYAVLHYIMKKITITPHSRRLFILGWSIFCVIGIFGSVIMIPNLQDLRLYASAEEFTHKVAIWASVFIVFGAAFVAMSCARRAFARHGGLG